MSSRIPRVGAESKGKDKFSSAPFLPAEIEPMPSAARHADEISRFDRDRNNWALYRRDVEQPAALDDEAHFVLIMPMFGIELIEHGFEARRCRRDINDIRGDVAALRF